MKRRPKGERMKSGNIGASTSPAQLTASLLFPEEVWFHMRGQRHFLARHGPRCVQVWGSSLPGWGRGGGDMQGQRERQRLAHIAVVGSV